MNKMCNIQDYVKGNGTARERMLTENFLRDASRYQPYISKRANILFQRCQLEISRENLNGNPNVAPLVDSMNQANLERETMQNQNMVARDEKVRTLTKNEERRAGFINASILLYTILNLGIVIAVTLIIL